MARRPVGGTTGTEKVPRRLDSGTNTQLDAVLDDWKLGLQELRKVFLHASQRCPSLFSATVHFPADTPRPDSQQREVWLAATGGRPPLHVMVHVGPLITWNHILFGDAQPEYVIRFLNLARSAFGNLSLRPGDAIIGKVRLEIGDRAAFWNAIMHMFAMDYATPNINCRQRSFLPKGFNEGENAWSIAEQLIVAMSSRQARSGFGEWEEPAIVRHDYSPAHYSVLNHDVFLVSTFAINLLLHQVEEDAHSSPAGEIIRPSFSQTEELCLRALADLGSSGCARFKALPKESRPTGKRIADYLSQSLNLQVHDSTLKSALSSLVKSGFAKNARSEGMGGGYYLTPKGYSEAQRLPRRRVVQ